MDIRIAALKYGNSSMYLFENQGYLSLPAKNIAVKDWDVGSVTEMWEMLYGASSFNRDLTSWCVSNIGSEPENFSEESALDEEHKPVWGTCPD